MRSLLVIAKVPLLGIRQVGMVVKFRNTEGIVIVALEGPLDSISLEMRLSNPLRVKLWPVPFPPHI